MAEDPISVLSASIEEAVIYVTACWHAPCEACSCYVTDNIIAGDGKASALLPMFASESPTRATEAQGALFGAHSAHLDPNYL